ncbi:radical SAM protein [Candidatus Absconditicoccus praedator]|uniref:radical SAM protein n=1 Tax=Candidatus Absconditicoccus praedator TaxID=2735562 RepID=UPI001E4A69F8|nr:radical SAM protein [Candidatus Absconditicoccus praedator]UFX83292.1 radical SAM protein [Candidatus Absconditicoccus praedator]
MDRPLLFEIVITNGCNKRCPYCDINFERGFIKNEVVDNFIKSIRNYDGELGGIHINFFGGEPLLGKQHIDHVLKSLEEIKTKITYSLVTNGWLIDDFIIERIYKYDIKVDISIDTINNDVLKENKHIKEIASREKTSVNYIFVPGQMSNIEETAAVMNGIGFENINIIPVYTTMSWNNENIKILAKKINQFIKISKSKNIGYFKYDRGFSRERQFILDVGGEIYQDVDSDIRLQKQYNIIPEFLKKKVENEMYLGNINYQNLNEIICGYDESVIYNLLKEFELEIGKQKEYKKIDKIIDYFSIMTKAKDR